MPVITAGQVAVFYSLTTGALLAKLVLTPQDQAVNFPLQPGQGVLVQSAALPYDDVACYALIAANTAFTPNQDTDRCAVMDHTSTVVDVQKRDPAILPVQPGEGALLLHKFAEHGDVFLPGLGTFQRRWVRINIAKATNAQGRRVGTVSGVALTTVDNNGVQFPTPASVHEIVRHSPTLQPNDTIDLTIVPPGIAQALAASDAAA